MEDYSITVIQEESVPLAAMPKSIINSSQWILAILCIAIIAGIVYYLILCWRTSRSLVLLKTELGESTAHAARLNYFKLRVEEQELQYKKMEIKNYEENYGKDEPFKK